MRITLLHGQETHSIEVDVDDSVEVLRCQIFSMTGVAPDEQAITGIGPGVLQDDAVLKTLDIQPGMWVMLGKRAAAPAAPAKVERTPEERAKETITQRAIAQMEARLRSGFITAVKHNEPDLQRQARALIPWERLCAKAKASRSGGGAADTPAPAVATTGAATEGLRRLWSEPQLVGLARAAHKDPTKLVPGLQAIADAAPALLALVKSHQEDFRSLVNGALPPLPSAIPAIPDEPELRELTNWFKHEFFSWVNAPACEVTGQPTQSAGMGAPNAEERYWEAGRVELYRGPTGHITRFPRYNHPGKLLETRKGRCGEWANAFTLCCRAVGFEARWVLDVTDHVWTEVWLPSMGRWVHADPCENVTDAPLLYEKGWGKQLSYVFSFGLHECVDVARRYSAAWEDTMGRRKSVPEAWISESLASLNGSRQASLPPLVRAQMATRASNEQDELLRYEGTRKAEVAKAAELRGRQTGSLAWRRARGELGTAGGAGGESGVGGGSGSGDAGLPPGRLLRVCGAVGAVVHGICFEREGGSREGVFLENSKERMDLKDEAGLMRRGGKWEALASDEYVTRVSGKSSTIGYCCATVTLTLSSGRSITFKGNDADGCSAGPFDIEVPADADLASIDFDVNHGVLGTVGVTPRADAPRCASHDKDPVSIGDAPAAASAGSENKASTSNEAAAEKKAD